MLTLLEENKNQSFPGIFFSSLLPFLFTQCIDIYVDTIIHWQPFSDMLSTELLLKHIMMNVLKLPIFWSNRLKEFSVKAVLYVEGSMNACTQLFSEKIMQSIIIFIVHL